MRSSLKLHKEYRRLKTPVARRKKQYVLFVDFAKAFDRVDRDILLQKMLERGYND